MSTDAHNNDDSGKKKKRSAEDFPIQEYRLVPADQYEEGQGEDNIELDLIELFNLIWGSRTIIIKYAFIGGLLGIIIALIWPKEYVSSATLMPEYASETDLGSASSLIEQYGGLIGLSGGTYNSASNAIRVDLYPKIVESLSFQKKLAEEKFYFADYDTTASFFEYYLELESPGILGWILEIPGNVKSKISHDKFSNNLVLDPEIINISEDEMKVIEMLRERVISSLDEETGIVSISAQMGDPRLAAQVAKFTIEELTDYLIEYRTEKVQIDLDFIEEQLASAEQRYQQAQLELAEFRDSNLGNLTRRAQTEEERLQSELDIAFNVYNTLIQQFEEAKIKVQEQTPVFKILQPVQVPVEDEFSGFKALFVVIFLATCIAVLKIIITERERFYTKA